MLRVRRHPAAGVALLAILTPLLAAGPGMPCAGGDAAHHREVGHVAAAGVDATGVDANAAAAPSPHAGHAQHAATPAPHRTHERGGVVPAPDEAPPAPAPPACSMGMMCSGTVVTPLAASLVDAPVVRALPPSDVRWTLHTSELSLPRRPPRA